MKLEQQQKIELKTAVREHIPANEKMIWCGKPKIKLFRPTDAVQIPFMVIWTAIPLTMVITMSVSHTPMPFIFLLMPLAFVGIGLYMIFGRFILEYLYQKDCIFVLTENKALTISKFPKKTISIDLTEKAPVRIFQKKDGTAQVFFEDQPDWMIMQREMSPFWTNSKAKVPTFFHLKEVAEVIELLKPKTDLVVQEQPGWLATATRVNLPAASSTLATGESVSVPSIVQDDTFKLMPGEKIVWQGKPEVQPRIRKTDVVSVPVMLLFALICSFPLQFLLKETMALVVSPWVTYAAVAVVLLLLGVITEFSMKAGTKYAITDKRIIALWTQAPKLVKQYSIDLTQIDSIDSSCYGDDTGIIALNKRDSWLVRWFGAEGIGLDPTINQGTTPFLVDVPRVRSVTRILEDYRRSARSESGLGSSAFLSASKNAVARREPRELPAGLNYKMMLGTTSAKLSFLIGGIAGFVGLGHFAGYGWMQIRDLLLMLQGHGEISTAGPPPFMFVIPLALLGFGLGVLLAHIRRTRMQLRVLRNGVCTEGRYLREAVVAQTNNKPSMVQREYEYSDSSGIKRICRVYAGVKSPLRRNVSVLYDPAKPNDSVVVEELPGDLRLSDKDQFISVASTRQIETKN